ncbi:uncharacterized protein LOC126185676 [Schistocerca cancellata]|uniref:uncharacterized protein LOC126185676 n=1 Tax=Schistocerca cancellata TaxID=274614 RepID=UPI00211872EF|nr:uncharacterized protein LOC126185676 [Schistocerca cancellata]
MYSKTVKVSSETRIHFRQTCISLSEAANKQITGGKTNRDSTGDLRCFICDGKITGTCFPLVVGVTPYSKTDIPTKIGQLMGEGFMVVVSEDDNLCKRCTSLLYQLDRLEVDLNLVKDALTNYLKLKYQLNEEDHEIATSRDDSSFRLYSEEENENDKSSCKKLCGKEGEVAVDEEFKVRSMAHCVVHQKGCLDSNKSSNQYMNNENFVNLFKKVSTQFMQVPNRNNNNLNGTELAIENVSGRVTSNSTTCTKSDCDSSQHADGEIDYTISGKNEQQSATTQNSTFENSSESLVTTHRSHSSEATQVNNSIPCNFPINKFMENARTDSAVKQKENSEKNVSSNSSHEYLLGAPYRDIQKSELVSKTGTESTKQKDCEMKAKVDNETSLSDSCGSISYPPQTMKELRTPFLFHITKPGTAQCEICGKFFSSNSKMMYHRDICSKNLSSSFLTKELCLTHEENCVFVPYCDECGEKFSEVDQVRSHKDTAHRDPHCRYCGCIEDKFWELYKVYEDGDLDVEKASTAENLYNGVLGLGCHLRSKGKHPDCVSAQLAMVEENSNVVGKPSTEVPRKSKCFVCDVIISDGGVWLMELLSVNANLLENIGSLMGDGAFVIVSWNDIVCNACSLLLKYFTKLERDLMILKKVLRYYLKVKYRLEDDGLDTNTTISRQDIDYIAECSSQVLSASDTEGSQLSYRPQKLDLALSQKSHCDKTEIVPRNKTANVSNSDTVSGLNRKETNIFKKEKLKTRNVAARKRCHFENYHSTSEHCKNNEAHEKQLEHTIDADVCVSTTDNMGCALNVEDHHSERQKCFMSHSLRNGNNDTKLPDQHDEAHSLLFKEGALKHKCPPGKNDNTTSVENSDGKMKNVISITLSSDSEQEFAEDQCIQSSTRDHMPQLPFMKSPVYRMLRKNSNSVTTQENKQVSEEKNKTDTFEENKKVINQSIFSEDIIVHDNTKPEKSGLKPLAKETGKIILNKGYVVASDSTANICTKTLENLIQKELPKCTESSVRSPPHSVVINGEQSARTESLDSSDQMLYLSQKTFKRPEKGTCGSPGSENVLKSIEDNQIMLHNSQSEWAGGLEIGLDDDMPHIVLGDEMVVDGSTCEEIAFEEIQDTSTHNNEKNYSIQREIAESNISKIENLNALCSGDAEIDFIESTTTEETAIRTGHEENANQASQFVSDTSSSGNQSAVSENSSINNERTILRSCDVKTRASLLFKENVSHLPACGKLFQCHICNRILTTQSNLKRHLLKHEKCTVGSIICELCNEQLVDRVHLKQHLKVQHQQYVKCAFCDKEFSNMKLCRDHELTHPERATYKCDICNQMFVTEGRLKNHKELIHDDLCDTFRDNDFFKCHICFKTLRTHHNLKRHLTNHEKPPVSVSSVPCNLCQEVFTEKSKLYQHREEKHPKKHNCTFCNKEFLSLRSCRIHESLHPERVVYKCNICETVFLTELRLNRHKDIYHREPYCRICRKEITDRSKLIEHERRHGRFKQVFMCKECPKVFRTASGLKYHMSVHTGKYAVYCEICGKGLHSEVVLAEHKATHTKEVRYTCELCGRTFSSNSTYRMHRLWHDNPLPYQCNFCDKKFKHTSILAVHKRRVHTGERPYKCKYCNMAFSVSSTLNKHLILHTKQYPFKCEQCSKGFTTRTKIANHLAKVHNDDSMLIAGKKVCEYKMALRPSEMADVESLHEFPTDETDEMDL